MAEEILAYCVKEKTKKPMKDAHEVTLKNGKHALQGVCSSCGTKMMMFVSSKKASVTREGTHPHDDHSLPSMVKTEEPETAQPAMASVSPSSTAPMDEPSKEEDEFAQEPMTVTTM